MNATSLVSGLLLTVGSVGVAFFSVTNPVSHHAPWMRNAVFSIIANVGGFASGLLAIYVMVSSLGWLQGLGLWFVVALVFAMLVRSTMNVVFPLMFTISLLAILAGSYLFFASR